MYDIMESPESTTEQPNRFVDYLNTLQSIQGNNTSAIAENQARNALFPLIEEEHPLTNYIYEDLMAHRHVILTGHAGDGKSTIAVELYKRLKGLSIESPLDEPLKPEESIPSAGVTLVKDLSENGSSPELLGRMLAGGSTFLLITNTGTLLNMLKGHPAMDAEREANLLKCLQSPHAEYVFSESTFTIYNLAQIDNLPLARRVFLKVLAPEHWMHCASCAYKEHCPILLNRNRLAQDGYRAVDRIFLIYRRLLTYGTRLTMRQIMEHLSWSITGGQTLRDIRDVRSTIALKGTDKNLFHHLFFGNDGQRIINRARHMKAISALRSQGFGMELSPDLERRLWTEAAPLPYLGMADGMMPDLENLKKRGLRPKASAECHPPNLEAAAARASLRRMVFFLGQSESIDKDIDAFLDSPFTRIWTAWTEHGTGPDENEKRILLQELYFVLKEQFSGQKSAGDDSEYLYITQHRDVPGLRQSVQLLTAKIHLETQLKTLRWKRYVSLGEAIEGYRLELCYTQPSETALRLDVAFLDYVCQRYRGEISGAMARAFRQRLDNFRNRLISLQPSTGAITLLRSMTDNVKETLNCELTDSGNLRVY